MKILDDVEAQVGRWAIAGVAIVVLVVVQLFWHRRNPVQPVVAVTPAPAVPAAAAPIGSTPPPVAAVAQATSAATTHVRVIIRRWPRGWTAAPVRSRVPAEPATASGSDASSAAPSAISTDSPPIEIDVTTTSTTSAVAAATASEPLQVAAVPVAHSSAPTHGRIGVLAATVPGVLAVDLEAIQFRTPWWLVGQPVEVGLDGEANLAEVGAGISVGSKAFGEAGGYLGYQGLRPGIYVGAGLRF